VVFLGDLLGRLDVPQRQVLTRLLLRLHSQALYQRTESAYNAYEPLALTVPARHAAWSANLVVLAVLNAGKITGTQLFPREPDPAVPWRDQAMMWRSQLTSEEWFGLHEMIALERLWDGNRREIRLWRDDGTFAVPASDIYWTYNVPPGHPSRRGILIWAGHSPRALQRKANFTAGKSDDFMAYALQPVADACPAASNVFVNLDTDRPLSAAQVLTAALLALQGNSSDASQIYSDLAHVTRELAEASTVEHDFDAYLKVALSVLLSAAERGAVPAEMLAPFTEAMNASTQNGHLTDLLTRMSAVLRNHPTSGNSPRHG
jgi:hypothetical protein